jgi:eukaryotic-like serine/threonine-protein kinase
MNSNQDGRNPVEKLAEEFLARYRGGERPPLSEYIHRYPEMADDIRELFPALVMMEVVGPAFSDTPPARTTISEDGRTPHRLGDYRLLREIGRGGMGIVYEAEQEALGRHVALKVLPFQSASNPLYLLRFRRESRSAARLHHTNIVPVFDVGESDGTYYYAMQLIQGLGLDEVLAELRNPKSGPGQSPDVAAATAVRPGLQSDLAIGLVTGIFPANQPPDSTVFTGVESVPTDKSERAFEAESCSASSARKVQSSLSRPTDFHYFHSVARIGVQVADALSYAHGQKVLHRDIKPANLLLDDHGTIWITDFGLAKAEGDNLTRSGDVVGTLRYMAPERFAGNSDARSDLYSLGLTLYELVTLQSPFGDSDRARLIQRVARENPRLPHKINPSVPRDLETIIVTAMAKEPRERYQSAELLAEDLRLFLADRPIRARRSSAWEYAWRWCRRNPINAGLGAAVLLLLLVVLVGLPVQVLISRERDNAVAARVQASELLERAREAEAKVQLRSHLARAAALRHGGQAGQRFRSLDEIRQALALAPSLADGSAPIEEIRDEAIACLCLPDIDQVYARANLPRDFGPFAIDSSFTRFAISDKKGNISIRQIADDRQVATAHCEVGPGFAHAWMKFSPDGRFLHLTGEGGQPRLWRLDGADAKTILADGHYDLTFSPDSKQYAASYPDGMVRLFDAESGRAVTSFATRLKGRLQISWNPRLPLLLVGIGKGWLLLNLNTGSVRETGGSLPLDAASWMLWHPNGRTVAVAGANHVVFLWDTEKERLVLPPLKGNRTDGLRMLFSHRGDRLLSTDWSGSWRLWDTRTGDQVLWRPASDAAFFFSPSDDLVGADLTPPHIRFLHFCPGREFQTAIHFDESLEKVGYVGFGAPVLDPTGRFLALSIQGAGIALLDLQCLEERARLPGDRAIGFLPDGSLLTYGKGGIYRWPAARVSTGIYLGPPESIHTVTVPDMHGMSADGRVLAVPLFNQGALVVHRDRGRQVLLRPQEDVRYCAVSPDARWVATGTHWLNSGDGAKVWDARTGTLRKALPVGGVCFVQFSPDGKWLLTCGGGPRLWSVDNWDEGPALHGTVRNPHAAFSWDSRLLALGDDAPGVVRLVATRSGTEVARLTAPLKSRLLPYCFTRDESRLVAVGTEDGAVHMFDLRAIRLQLAKFDLDWSDEPVQAPSGTTNDAEQPIEVDVGDYGLDSSARRKYWRKQVGLNSLLLELSPLNFRAALARGTARSHLGEHDQAVDDYSLALALAPPECRGLFAEKPAEEFNNRAWQMALAPGVPRNQSRALALAQTALELAPGQWSYRNTLGAVCYRTGNYEKAIEHLERSLKESNGEAAGFNLFFLAMSYHRLGDFLKARDCHTRALTWIVAKSADKTLPRAWEGELASIRAEADALLEAK